MIMRSELCGLTARQLDARAAEAHAQADQLWEEWDAAGRPEEMTNTVLDAPLNWMTLIHEARDLEHLADTARWRVAVESMRWRKLPPIGPTDRKVIDSAYWWVTNGRTRVVHSSIASRELAVRSAATLVTS